MKKRRWVALLLASTLLLETGYSAKAFVPPPPPPPSVLVTSSASTAGLAAVGGFIGVVAFICVWDFMQKVQGLKNWDGTPKTTSAPRSRRP